MNRSQRVSKTVVQGQGCSSCAGGLGTYTYAYSQSANADGYNSWSTRTVETLPDGTTNTVYSNAYGEPMLKVYTDASSHQWVDFYKYDGQGRVTLHANPSAVTGFNDADADLLNNQSGNYQYLADNAGLIELTDYYSGTTTGLSDTTSGGVAGYVQDTAIEHGELGTHVLKEGQTYFAHAGGGATVYPEATDTLYGNADGTDARTTRYAYAWFGGTTQVQSETVTQPAIVYSNNGPASSGTDTADADTTTTFYDSFSRPVWTRDGDDFLTYTAYDPGTGAVIKSIADVNTADTGDFANLPTGWTTPTGGGLELLTTYQVDSLGRTTEVTSPAGNVTYTVYKDARNATTGFAHEVRTYPGWHYDASASGYRTTGPIEVSREYQPGPGAASGSQTLYEETLTSAAAPDAWSGVPVGDENLASGAGVQSLSRDLTNAAGQTVESDRYVTLAGQTYSGATLRIGSANTNYYATTFGFDNRGWNDKTVSPTGTITYNVHDGLGRVVSRWVGTNDTGATHADPSSGGVSPNNMIRVESDQYDNGGVGDPDLTMVTAYPDNNASSGANNRVTDNFYDWRDRLVASKQGVQATEADAVHRPILYYSYDNLDEVTQTDQYDGDGVTITTSSGVPQAPPAASSAPAAPAPTTTRAAPTRPASTPSTPPAAPSAPPSRATPGTTTAAR